MQAQPARSRNGLVIVLLLLSVTLAAGLIYLHVNASGERRTNAASIHHFSNQWVEASIKLKEQKLVNLTLERDYVSRADELKAYSNQCAAASSNLYVVRAQFQNEAESASAQLQEQSARIQALQQERDGLTHTMGDLTASIATLEQRIADVEQKLETSTSERDQLLADLDRLKAEKADLERRFNSLVAVREQVRKLRDELSLSRRLEWIRQGITGAPKHKSFATLASAAATKPDFGLDVQLNSAGRQLSTDSSATR